MPFAGDPIRADDFFELRGFTPTFSSGVTALGVGNVREGWYVVSGEFCTWGFRIECGTTPNGNAVWQLDLPVAAYTGGGNDLNATLGNWSYRWNGGSLFHYSGTIGAFVSSGTIAFLGGAWDGTAPRQRVGTNSSTLGHNGGSLGMNQGDVISGGGRYRIA